jgi:hypothetical protein
VDHDPAQAFLIAALAAVGLAMLVPLIIYLRNKLFFFDWPPLYEWQQARRQLHRIDQGRVIWATYRHHPASRATLADAQLAYARYRQASAQRALDRRRPGRRVRRGSVVRRPDGWQCGHCRHEQSAADRLNFGCGRVCHERAQPAVGGSLAAEAGN